MHTILVLILLHKMVSYSKNINQKTVSSFNFSLDGTNNVESKIICCFLLFMVVSTFKYFFSPGFRIPCNGRTNNALKVVRKLSHCIADPIYIEAEDREYSL